MDKTEMLMNLKDKTQSTVIEYYQEIRNIYIYNFLVGKLIFKLVRIHLFVLS